MTFPNSQFRWTITVKLGIKELFNKEQIGNSEPFPVTNLQVYLINSEQIGISENFVKTKKFLNAKFDYQYIQPKQIFFKSYILKMVKKI